MVAFAAGAVTVLAAALPALLSMRGEAGDAAASAPPPAAVAARLDFELVAHALPLGADGEPREADFAVVINMQVARTLRLFPPLPLLQVAETVN